MRAHSATPTALIRVTAVVTAIMLDASSTGCLPYHGPTAISLDIQATIATPMYRPAPPKLPVQSGPLGGSGAMRT
eukprot:15439584-Alexandrium_andersonii.AAC.1